MTVKGRASKTPSHDAIAVIGIGCRYPGAKNPQELWENILARRQAFRRMPDVRMPPGDYFDADPKTPDKSYSARAAVIDGFAFDWRTRRIPEQSANSTDIVHWLALEVTLDALNDSGLNDTRVPKERTGVVIGNTLTGEHTRAQTMRLRWPFVARTLVDTASTMQLPSDMTAQILRMAETRFKSVFQPVNEDTLAGSLANTIAGRICNFLDLHGGGYTVDGACSSSLIAVATAANALANGDLDLAIAGGVDVSLDPFELIGFAKAGALTATEMRVYDEAGNGFMPGEGAGVVILKRLSDARRDGDNVYAVLKGWGISSDGKGGITAPKSSGQALAITRAYERAGYSPHTLDFIEGHGTGTRVGDKVELEGIAQALANFGEPPARKVGMTSFKSICGHTKAAAGVGGFIKAVIAVNRRVLPPTAGCERPNASFADQASCLYPLISGEKRPASDTLRAGVSAMGFGGINSHVTLESGDAPSDKFAPSINEETLLGSYQRHELFLFSAPNLSTLLTQFKNAAVLAHTASIAELADLSANLIRDLNPDHPVRAAFTVHTPEELVEFLRDAVDRLSASPLKPSERYVSPCKRVWITHLKSNEQPKLGFVFAGQGAQQLGMARTLLTRFAWARDLLSAADAWLAEVGCDPIGEHLAHLPERAVTNDDAWLTALTKTRIAQPAIAFVSLLWFERLKHLGLKAHVVAGHSLGELTALYAAGSIDAKTLIQLAGLRGSAMAATPSGGMLALRATGDEAARMANEINATTNTTLVVANINSPTQAVLSGDVRAIEAAQASAQTRKLSARPLRVSGAFHSPLMLSAAEGLKAHAIANKTFASSTTTILSCMHGDPINPAGAIGDFVATQMLSSVNFVALATNLSASCDLILELGPSRILSSLIEESTASTKNAPIALPVEPQPLSDQSASLAIGAAFALGANIDFSRLHEGRLIRPFVAASDMSFIENPCERPFTVNELDEANATAWQTAFSSNSAQAGTSPWSEGFVTGAMALATGLSPEVLTAYLRERGAYLRDIIEIDLESHPLATLATSKTAAPIVALAEKASPQKDRTMLPPPDASSKMHQSLRAAQDEAIEKLAAVPVAQTSSLPTTLPSDRVIVELAARRTGFPPASIEMQHRVLDDLNLDSIKAAEIVGEAAKQIGVAELVDPMQFANARLSDIADALDKARATLPPQGSQPADPAATESESPTSRSSKPIAISKHAPRQRWVRNFAIEKIATPLVAEKSLQETFAGARVLLADSHVLSDKTKDALERQLMGFGASVESISLSNEAVDTASSAPVHLMAFFGETFDEAPHADRAHMLQALVEKLTKLAHQIKALASAPKVSVALVEIAPAQAIVPSTHAWAASLHLEEPTLFVRHVRFESLQNKQLSALLGEFGQAAHFSSAEYDAKGKRTTFAARVQDPSRYQPRTHTIDQKDVVVVTGGARGITAACALALAKKTGAHFALLGSSAHPEANPQTKSSLAILATLEQFAQAGIRARYYQCDVNQPGDVKHVLAAVANARRRQK